MADELIDPDTMARLSAMMRRAPMDQSSAAGMVPSPALPPNPYNTEFPDYIGNPNANFVMPEVSSMIGPDFLEGIRARQKMRERAISTELPAVYNERFPPYIEERPALGFSPGPGESRWDAYGVRSAFPGNSYPPAMLPQADPGLGAELRDYRMPTAEFQPAMPLPDSGRDARVEQLIRDMQEQEELEARLRAMGR